MNVPERSQTETVTQFTIRRIRAEIMEECAKIAENCFGGQAHTYASENADRYIIQDETCELIARKIRAKASAALGDRTEVDASSVAR